MYHLACAALSLAAGVCWALDATACAAVLFAFVSGRLWQAHAAPEGPVWFVRARLWWETRWWDERFGQRWGETWY